MSGSNRGRTTDRADNGDRGATQGDGDGSTTDDSDSENPLA